MSEKPIPSNPPRWRPNSDPASIVIPGLDTDSSTIDQIEQIEQLITIKLQNIDENFSKIHNVLANKLLPAVKRYAVGTEPVREAAKFWTSFYEQAAQIRIPTYDDYSTINEIPSERDEAESSSHEQTTEAPGHRTEQPQEVYETTVNSETSFLPGQGAFSSTPATARMVSTHQSFASQGSDDPSWTRSMESPFDRLDREIKDFSSERDESLHPAPSSEATDSIVDYNESSDGTFQRDATITTIPHSAKGKGKDTSHPLLKNVLRHNLYAASDNSSFELKSTSPLKFRGKPKTPIIDKKLNPYLPPDTSSSVNWSGVVDLRDPSVMTPKRHRPGKAAAASTTTATTTPGGAPDGEDDDSFDALPPGMSPPVLLSPARPPRSSAELGMLVKLRQTPVKEASARIQQDLLKSALKSAGRGRGVAAATATSHRGGRGRGSFIVHHHHKPGSETSMSTVPTPPSLSRYKRAGGYEFSISPSMAKDVSLEGMIRSIRNDIGARGSIPGLSTTPGLRIQHRALPEASAGWIGSTLPTLTSQQLQKHNREQHQQQRRPSKQSAPTRTPPSPRPAPEPSTPVYEPLHPHDVLSQEDDGFSDSDSLESINNTAHPSAAFLMASGGVGPIVDDDSFGSSNHSSDSLENEDLGGGLVPVHPFATNAVVEDDGFDDDDDSSDGFEVGIAGAGFGQGLVDVDAYQEETVFGLPPAPHGGGGRPSDGQQLRMLGEELLQDTIGIGAHIAANGRGVDESPTPAGWGR